jgi:hypothetical protein
MNERMILNLVYTSRDAWEKVHDRLTEKEFSPHGWAVFQEIGRFYGNDPDVDKCDTDIVLSRLRRAYPKAEEIFSGIIGGFTEVSVPNALQELYDFKRKGIKERLATKLLDDKQENFDAIDELWGEYNSYKIAEEDDGPDHLTPLAARTVGDVVHRLTSGDSVVKLYPKTVNEAVGGGVPLQTHIIVFATPEVGKSAFIINQAVMSAVKDGHKVLLFDNEDPEDQTWMRIQTNVTGMTREEIYHSPDKAQQLLDSIEGYKNLVVVSHNPGTMAELEDLMNDVKPKLFICNQIRNLHFRGVDGDVAQLTVAGRAMRSLIKRHNLVGISVTQAADSASRKAVLDIGDVYMSNTSLPGDADLMIGIGGTPDMIETGYRMLSFPKNKITGDHEPRSAMLHKQLSKYTSL